MEIELLRRDGTVRTVTLIDDEDYERLNVYRWRLMAGRRRTKHVGRGGNNGQPLVLMHQAVLGVEDDPEFRRNGRYVVDHINRDPLDNRRSNLRICTHSENTRNSERYENASSPPSPYPYVSWNKKSTMRPWRAIINVLGRQHYVGSFADPQEAHFAAIAYRAKALA